MKLLSLLMTSCLCVFGALSAPPDDELAARSPESIGYGDELLIQIAVTDLDAACTFYSEVMGLQLEERVESLKWAKFLLPTGARLGVGEQADAAGSGSTSINLSVRQLDAARATLEGRGIEFDGPTVEIPGVVRLADFVDPFGIRFRLAGAAR